MKLYRIILPLLALASLSSPANATLVEFTGINGSQTINGTSYSYTEDNLNFSYAFSSDACGQSADAWCFTGNTGTFSSNELFDLVSFEVMSKESLDLMTIRGENTSSNTLYESGFSINNGLIEFSGWNDINFVTITFAADGTHIIDNINIKTANVPTPATLLLIGAGIAGLVATRRKQKKA